MRRSPFASPAVPPRWWRPAFAAAAVLMAATATAAPPASDPHAAHRAAMRGTSGASPTRVTLPATRLRMRDGRDLRLDAAAFGDRVVVVDFIYTHCTTICPALTGVLAAVQADLDRRGGDDDWLLVSLSVDPARDTPARMDAYARNVGAGKRWWWLTGDANEVDRSLRAFGVAPGRPEDHAPMVLVGRPARGEWLRWVGMPDPAQLRDAVAAMRRMPAQDAAQEGRGHGGR